MDNDRTACAVASSYLAANADALVVSWIDWVKSRISTSTINALSDKAIRNHIPPILMSVANYIVDPVEITRQELLGHLQLHAQVRRDQGYTLQEVLAEFDGLAEVTTQGMTAAIDAVDPEHRLTDRLEAGTRLAHGLRSISFIAAGTYASLEAERARSLSGGQGEILRAIAHELSNPLMTISLSLDLIEDELEGASSIGTHLDHMKIAVERASHLLQTIRTVAVAEGARSGEHMVQLDVALQELKQEFQSDLASRLIEWRDAENLPDVWVEAAPFSIAVSNLITNAIKYADPDKHERWVSIRAQFIADQSDTGFCDLTVEDNGIGIAAEFQARICQKGFRAHPSVAHGTGHGLYLTREALIARGGSVTLESVEGVGTSVTVRLRCLASSGSAITSGEFSTDYLMGQSQTRGDRYVPELPSDVRLMGAQGPARPVPPMSRRADQARSRR